MSHLAVDGRGQLLLAEWAFVSLAPGQANTPAELACLSVDWASATVPGTVASSRRELGFPDWGQLDLDAQDHWYRCSLELPESDEVSLCFDGLATLAQVYWNDELILRSSNMFIQHEVDVSNLPRSGTLMIHFQSLTAALATRRPRPRWRTRLVEHQQLRWVRTSLMGRIPGWSPTAAPVGPYRAIKVRTSDDANLLNSSLRVRLRDDVGHVAVKVQMRLPAKWENSNVFLRLGDECAGVNWHWMPGGLCEIAGQVLLDNPQTWWPHSHGKPSLYSLDLIIQSSTEVITLELGMVGFRNLKVDQENGAFQVQVNGVPVFCRGACWTPVDVLSLNADEKKLRRTLEMVRDAGMNMIRIGGTMVYESDAFYQICDELGILVWQDFMFANMDYPVDDEAFAASIATEAKQFLSRIQSRPSVVVLCGGSEIEQQAAMLGLAPESWRNHFFGSSLPALCAQVCPQVQYLPSSPSGGVMPFQIDQSVSHYYGVGAYLRPIDDARRAGVRFTSECLGFSNIPEESTIDSLLGNGQQPFHHPVWKQRVPRDSGAGWDFEDVRDHYLADLFKVDPMRLRYSDMLRYLYMSRVATGEVMARTMAEWRRGASACQGALVWFLRDLWPGAGWGVIDALGVPKAAYFALKRVLAPVAVTISDEGLNGLVLHVFNDGPSVFEGLLSLQLLRHGQTQVAHARHVVQIPPHGSVEVRADAMFLHFMDTSYAYRFGPPGHHAVVATLSEMQRETLISQAFHFPVGFDAVTVADLGLDAKFVQKPDDVWAIQLQTQRMAQFVQLDIPGCQPSDNYFHLAPGSARLIKLHGQFKSGNPKGMVSALNGQGSTKIGAIG